MSVKVSLRGDRFDLETLVDLFSDGEPKVVQDGERFYLSSQELDDLEGNAGELNRTALVLLRRVNGVARAVDGGYRPVEVAGGFTSSSGTTQVIGAAKLELRIRGRAVAVVVRDGVERPPPPPRGPLYFAKVADNDAVGEVLDILGKPAPGLDWFDLYKVFEIIRDDVGGEKVIMARQWATDPEINAFRESANRPQISGEGARHARLRGLPSGRSMNLQAGQSLIKNIAAKWLDSL